jgi:hypothetical protein
LPFVLCLGSQDLFVESSLFSVEIFFQSGVLVFLLLFVIGYNASYGLNLSLIFVKKF